MVAAMDSIPFYDDGGPSANYIEYTYAEWYHTFTTDTGHVVLNLTSFMSEQCCDYMRVYDGPTASGSYTELKGELTSITASNPRVITSTGNSLTVHWHTDGSVVRSGWKGYIYNTTNLSKCIDVASATVHIKDANGGTLHKIKCNKKDNTQVADELISPMCYDNGIIYYTGVSNDHDIHALHTKDGDITTPVISGFYFFPVVKDGYLYYLNGTSNYSLWRTNLTNGEQQLVTSDRCDCFTIDNNHIYYSYSNAMNPSLRRCDLDGGNKVVLFEGVVNSINVTSRYVYFKVFGDDNTYFHIPVDLSAPASAFTVIAN